ncbi:hypothetical protein BCR32DRAFT_307001 [Anaeromyces robustus]|uniref:Uncharacterized protein n=1 Tax=Anaeromyces robustus TaxID=1754192 RepID=A0A1Y1XEY2_9FUNG|nr:hypothetical protein BCR32DRAFT_307001 [Anaeromyces robustus]|eukprot:ORX84277.1 hypothetical protein BCR32DRAFT_307001 [Anaeromyces robustus]
MKTNEICVIDNKFVSSNKSIYYLSSINGFDLSLKDSQYKLLYICSYNSFTKNGSLKDSQNNLVYTFKNKIHFFKSPEIFINCYNENQEKKQINLKFASNSLILSGYNYTVEFYNKATESVETLEVNCSNKFNCTIYHYGKLICKFNSPKTINVDFKIEISPGVDTMFINILINSIYRYIQSLQIAAAAC